MLVLCLVKMQPGDSFFCLHIHLMTEMCCFILQLKVISDEQFINETLLIELFNKLEHCSIHTYIHRLYFLSNFRVACNTINISS